MPGRALKSLIIAASALLLSQAASGQDYPSKVVTVVNGFSSGGAVDTVARALSERLSASLGQNFIVESRPGAGSNLAAMAVVRSAPDGHTLLLGTNGLAINMALYKTPGFDVEKDLAPISMVGDIPAVIAAHPSFPANSIAELIAYAKQKPNEASYATPGNGSLPHLAVALLSKQAGIELRHVAYRGGHPAVTDAIGGHVPLVVVNALEATPYIKEGRLKGLAVTGPARLANLPDVPTVAEGPELAGFDAQTWWALFAPAGTPPAVVQKLQSEVHKALADPKLRERIETVGGRVRSSTAAELGAFVTTERKKWGQVVADTGLRE
ncbi:MAG TPA: tripartite tricarboxylate transporter substrate binding protein [Bosea sp. (in: a-proteobacteria)]|uniref:Bug family tripartite tricarboxylate transporter substrate binding protein n=1 Tax=Bosea sp. (in: a-proteobacteria) TaxID=1871050 RepID=UPI002E0DC228|nr:tripartite tricarboxylate transporter substrate binding protein [Bosea sp. (in: a-proteobacteria)]